MKRLITYSLITIFLLNLLSAFTINNVRADLSDENQNLSKSCFVVTAYYSPLPNQNYYFRGSYDADIVLNGKGIKGASGKAVFSGMLAAPKSYPFGTKIYLDGIGVGEVADRGGAIVAVDAGDSRGYQYDRIDIWMGYGEEGLKRALTWGKKTVCNSYVLSDEDNLVTLDVTKFPAPNSALLSLKKAEINIFAIDIGVNSDIEKTKKLHTFLSSLGYYKGNINSVYNKETVKAIYNFQIDNKIINSVKNNGAGLWGQETRKVALDIKVKKDAEELKKKNEQIENNSGETNVSDPILALLSKNIGPDSSKEDVKNIQTVLKRIGVYNKDINGNYSDLKDILVSYQISKKIVKTANEDGAGYVGPKTKTEIKSDYTKVLALEKAKTDKENQIRLALEEIKKTTDSKVSEHMSNLGTPKEGDVGTNVRLLQQTLNMFGYFKGKDTAIFGKTTKEALISYQLDKGIIKSKTEDGAGVFGPNTKEKMKSELYSLIETKLLTERNLLVYKK